MNWWNNTPCQQSDPNIWQAEDYYNQKVAKKACFECPGRLECLNEAMKNAEPSGVWGGLNVEEREQFRPTWEANGGVTKPIRQDHAQDRRLRKSTLTRKALLESGEITQEELRLLNILIANPSCPFERLGRLEGRSKQWMSDQLNVLAKRAGVS